MRLPFLSNREAPPVRPLAIARAREAAAIHAAFFARPWSEAEIEDLIRAPDTIADAATDGPGRALYGFAISRAVRPESELLTIAVDRRRQGAGVGRALLAGHLSRLSAAGARHVFLEVDQQNEPALKLYARFGFRQVGERKGYYVMKDGSRRTALVLRAELG